MEDQSRKDKVRTIIYSVVFGLTLFFQCIVVYYLLFHSFSLTRVFTSSLDTFAFLLPKISICCLLAAIVPLFRKKEWTIAVSLIINIWIVANLVYYRVNGILLDEYSFTMMGNMKGFWDGVVPFIHRSDLLLLVLPTLVLIILYCLLKPRSTSRWSAAVLFVVSIVLHISGASLLYLSTTKNAGKVDFGMEEICYNPFVEKQKSDFWGFSTSEYLFSTSVIHFLANDTWNLMKIPFAAKEQVSFEESEVAFINHLFNSNITAEPVPTSPLYIILFESLESWAVTPVSTPSIYAFIQSHDNILWAKKNKPQVKGGTSADGQMIINAGVLPVSEGAACFRFPWNIYPSISELYETSALVMKEDLATWNQKKMSEAYKISDNVIAKGNGDAAVFDELIELYQNHSYVLALTMGSHVPFNRCPDEKKVNWNSEMPQMMSSYLNCVHFTDFCMKEFLEKVDTDEILRNSTIIITGDHTIFDDDYRKEFRTYCLEQGDSFDVDGEYCPMIIYSPSIKQKTVIEYETYQMDIFPTALHAIGCDGTYYWKGFGINLLDPSAERLCTEDEAFILSDKMIRADYWRISYKD